MRSVIKFLASFTINEFAGIPFEVVRRRVKYSRVEFKAGHLRVIVPRGVNPMRVLEDNREVILKKHYRLQRQMESAQEIPVYTRNVIVFQELVSRYVQHYGRLLNVEAKGVKFRKMRRRWGSCRNDGMITLNSFLQGVPEPLIAYVVYHELAHLLVRGHNQDFKRVIIREFPHYRVLDKELNLYGLKLLT